MTRALTRTPPPATALNRKIVGTADEVARTVALVRVRARLVEMSPPRLRPDGQWAVTVRFLPPVQIPTDDRRGVVRRRVAIGVLVLALVAGVGYAVWVAVAALLPLLPAVGVVLALVLLGGRLLHRSACSGLHCPGCRR